MNRRDGRGRARFFSRPPGGGGGGGAPPPTPAPSLTSVAPTSKHQSDAPFTLTATGANFTASSVIRIDGANRTTTFVNAGSLTCSVTPSALTAASHAVDVTDPNGTSGTQTLSIDHAAPTLASISPTSVTAGAANTTLTCTGTGFDAATVIYAGATALTTTYVSATQVTAVVPSAMLATPGATSSITAVAPTPGGGTSAAQTLTVNYPAPTASSLSVTSATVGSGNTTTRVTGTGFYASGTFAQVDGGTVASSYVDATHIDVTVPSSALTSTGTRSITIVNPSPGGGTSSAQSFAVNNPVPTTSSLGTTSDPRWDGTKTGRTLTGTGFVPGSVVQIDGVAVTTGYASSTQLTFTIPNTVLWENGTKSITVVNATPGGGTSNAQTYTVTQPTWLQAEYRADKPRTMNGSNVQVWPDQSGRGDANRNASQLTAAKQPAYVASEATFNNQPSLTFTGASNTFLQSGAFSAAVAQPDRLYLVGINSQAATAVMVDGLGSSARREIYRSGASQASLAVDATVMNTTAWDTTTAAVIAAEFNGASSKFTKSAKTFGVTGTLGTASAAGLTIGNYFGGVTVGMTGKIPHVIHISSSTVTTAQHGEIMDYLGNKYGITIGA